MISNETAAKLAALGSRRQEYQEFFRALAERRKNATMTEVDWFLRDQTVAQFGHERNVRAVAVEFLRELERLQLGKFVIGRRGQASRFVWGTPLLEVVSAAGYARMSAGSGSEVPIEPGMTHSASTPPRAPNGEMVGHSFLLRAGLKLELQLPLNLTEIEADRIATFVKSLPLRQGE